MLAFGCSIVQGEELETELTVPKLFAKYLNEPLENFSNRGASNEEILFTAFENMKPGHTILVGLTDISRVYWPHTDTDCMQSQQVDSGEKIKEPLKGLANTLDLWVKFCYNEYTLEHYYYKRFKHLEQYCQQLGNKIYFFSSISPPDSQLKQFHGNNWFTKISLVNYCDDNNLGRMPKGHPTSKAHQEYFKEMITGYKL